MPVPAKIPYPLGMDEKVYATIDGKPATKAEFDSWVERFTDEFVHMSPDALSEFWNNAALVPYNEDTPTQLVSFRLSDAELKAIDRKAAAAGYSRDEFFRIAILLALA